MKDDKIVLYMHAGSGNHGCEAIVNSLCRMLPKPAILMTNRPKEDETYSLKELYSSFVQEKSIEKNVFVHTWYYLKRKLLHDPDCFMEYRYQDICGKNLHRLNISIGGDNYCYDNMLDRLISANRMFHRQGAKTVLYGCSIEPEIIRSGIMSVVPPFQKKNALPGKNVFCGKTSVFVTCLYYTPICRKVCKNFTKN